MSRDGNRSNAGSLLLSHENHKKIKYNKYLTTSKENKYFIRSKEKSPVPPVNESKSDLLNDTPYSRTEASIINKWQAKRLLGYGILYA